MILSWRLDLVLAASSHSIRPMTFLMNLDQITISVQ